MLIILLVIKFGFFSLFSIFLLRNEKKYFTLRLYLGANASLTFLSSGKPSWDPRHSLPPTLTLGPVVSEPEGWKIVSTVTIASSKTLPSLPTPWIINSVHFTSALTVSRPLATRMRKSKKTIFSGCTIFILKISSESNFTENAT